MKISFRIDTRSKKTEKPIQGLISNGKYEPQIRFSTKQSIGLKNWNSNKSEVTGNTKHAIEVRDKIYELKRFIEVTLPQEYGGHISSEDIKKELRTFFGEGEKGNNVKAPSLLFYFEKYIEINQHLEYNTLRIYGTVKKNLKLFLKKRNHTDNLKKLENKQYSLLFFQSYLDFLFTEKKYLNPSAETDFKKIGRVINYFDLDIKTHKSKLFNSFSKKVNYEQTQTVIITKEEAEAVWEYEPENHNEWEAKMCYLFSYETGLEISALYGVSENMRRTVNQMDPETKQIVRFEVMDVVTKKHRASNMRTIYLTKRAKQILKECSVKGPFHITDWDMKKKIELEYPDCALPVNFNMLNRNIKEVCKKVARRQLREARKKNNNVFEPTLNQSITEIKYRGGEKIVTKNPKWKLITMHTARHSYINNLKYISRLNITEAGELAGHASYKTTEKFYERENLDMTLLRLHKAVG